MLAFKQFCTFVNAHCSIDPLAQDNSFPTNFLGNVLSNA
jgi:hypothetical protein